MFHWCSLSRVLGYGISNVYDSMNVGTFLDKISLAVHLGCRLFDLIDVLGYVHLFIYMLVVIIWDD